MTKRPEGLRYGVVSTADQRAMSGLDFVQAIVDGRLPHNAMAQTLGYWIASVAEGRVTIMAQPAAAHFNPAGTVHGGFSATLLDSCMGLAVHSTLPQGWGQTTLEFKISFTRPITADTGLITAEGNILSRGRRTGTAEGRLTDAQGRLLAHATTTCLIFEH